MKRDACNKNEKTAQSTINEESERGAHPSGGGRGHRPRARWPAPRQRPQPRLPWKERSRKTSARQAEPVSMLRRKRNAERRAQKAAPSRLRVARALCASGTCTSLLRRRKMVRFRAKSLDHKVRKDAARRRSSQVAGQREPSMSSMLPALGPASSTETRLRSASVLAGKSERGRCRNVTHTPSNGARRSNSALRSPRHAERAMLAHAVTVKASTRSRARPARARAGATRCCHRNFQAGR